MSALLAGPIWGAHVSHATLFAIAAVTLLACLLTMWFGALRHRARLRAVPLRIHVAGTRGKSTTTRLIAAGLRAGGRRVLAKTTGSEPRLILPDGSETTWACRGFSAGTPWRIPTGAGERRYRVKGATRRQHTRGHQANVTLRIASTRTVATNTNTARGSDGDWRSRSQSSAGECGIFD